MDADHRLMPQKGSDVNNHGAKVWYIPDCWLPDGSSGDEVSHECICVLNVAEQDAELSISLYFEDDEPIRDIRVVVPGERTRHLRMDIPEQIGGAEVPRRVPYAARVVSSEPIFVQYSRLDCSTPQMALMSTTAIGGAR
jgi:hypothetical protein